MIRSVACFALNWFYLSKILKFNIYFKLIYYFKQFNINIILINTGLRGHDKWLVYEWVVDPQRHILILRFKLSIYEDKLIEMLFNFV